MKIKNLKIESENLEEVSRYLKSNLSPDYARFSPEMSVLCAEKWKFLSNSTQMDMVVIVKKEDYLMVDIIGAAGGIGLFNISFWSESGFTKRMKKRLIAYCTERNISYSEA
jgi:hypothetical protein